MSRGDGVTALLALASRLGRCAVLRSCAQMVRSWVRSFFGFVITCYEALRTCAVKSRKLVSHTFFIGLCIGAY